VNERTATLAPPAAEHPAGPDAVDLLDRVHLRRFTSLVHRSRTLVRVDRTLPAHCPARVTRHGTLRMLLIAPGLTPAERVAFLDAALRAER
jgi:hypothetical protein